MKITTSDFFLEHVHVNTAYMWLHFSLPMNIQHMNLELWGWKKPFVSLSLWVWFSIFLFTVFIKIEIDFTRIIRSTPFLFLDCWLYVAFHLPVIIHLWKCNYLFRVIVKMYSIKFAQEKGGFSLNYKDNFSY